MFSLFWHLFLLLFFTWNYLNCKLFECTLHWLCKYWQTKYAVEIRQSQRCPRKWSNPIRLELSNVLDTWYCEGNKILFVRWHELTFVTCFILFIQRWKEIEDYNTSKHTHTHTVQKAQTQSYAHICFIKLMHIVCFARWNYLARLLTDYTTA